jgi:hypothetical protein
MPILTETLAPRDFTVTADRDELTKLRAEVQALTSLVRESIAIVPPVPACALTVLPPLTVRQDCHRLRQQCLAQRQALLVQRTRLLGQRQRLWAMTQRLLRALSAPERT